MGNQPHVLAAFNQGGTPNIAVLNLAKTPLGFDLAKFVVALQEYADLFAAIWGTPCKIVRPAGNKIPAGHWALVFLDDADQAGALGYHDLTPSGLPLSKIFVRTTLADHEQVSVTASHELVEMLVDPGVQISAQGPNGVFYAYETADAVEAESFSVQGIAMSNFVYPAWFEAFRKPGSVKFDHLDSCTHPFQILPGGYMPVFYRGRWTQVFGRGTPQKTHPRAELRAAGTNLHSHHALEDSPSP
jgi:hypothetical protein